MPYTDRPFGHLDSLSVVFATSFIALGAWFAAPDARAQAAASAGLEEIVVTARRREESLQDAPISITAFTGDMLAQQQIDQLNGIGQLTPNLVFDNGSTFSGANSSASVFIRGIGQVDFTLTTEPGVGIYLDGVYLSQTIGSVLDLVDIERVEVLRGPQGTLFGRNTIGGAINVTSRKPNSDKLDGDVEVTVGEYSRFDIRGSINVPITDTLSGRLSAAHFGRDGFLDAPNSPSGDELGEIDREAVRLALRWAPNDRFEANFNADYSDQDEAGVPVILAGTYEGESLALIGALADPSSPAFVPPPGPLPPPSFVDLHNILATVPLGEQGCLPPSPMTPPFCSPMVVPNELFGDTPFDSALVQSIDADSDNFTPLDTRSETEVWGVGLTLTYDFGWSEIKSITSFRNMEAFTVFDVDAREQLIGDLVDDFDVDQFTQEVQLSGVAMDGRLNWLVGGYFFEEDGLNLDDVEFVPIHILSGAEIDNESVAGFGQATFDFTDKLSVTAGIRYTDETKKFIVDDTCHPLPKGPDTLFDGTVVTCAPLQSIINPKTLNGTDASDPASGFLPFVNAPAIGLEDLPNLPMFPPDSRLCCLPISDAQGNIVNLLPGLVSGGDVVPRGTVERDFDDWTPLLSVSYKWTDDLLTYVSYSEGFKSGGFVQRVFPPKSEVPGFDPETANVYEVGAKWIGLDDRLRLNGAIFFTDYEDLQIEINDGIAPVTRNAAEAEIFGFEVEATAIPADNWLIQAGVGYLDAEYTELDPSQNFSTDIFEITLDSELVNAPDWSTNLGVQYTFDFAGGHQLIARGDWAYVDDHFKDALNFPELKQDSYSLFDAYLVYIAPSGNWEASIFGKNLGDEDYIVSGFANGLTQGRANVNLGRPREWGASLTYRFGR